MASLYDRVFAEVQVRATTLGQQAGGILLNLLGFASSLTDTDAETDAGEPAWGTPGMYCRPLDATGAGCAEYIAARGVDDLRPIAGRDLRITQARTTAGGNVGKGVIGIAGYGGAYVEIANDPTTGRDVVTVKNGTLSLVLDPIAKKATLTVGALSVVLDAGALNQIALAHPLGAVTLGQSGVGASFVPGGGVVAALELTAAAASLSFLGSGPTASITLGPGGTVVIAGSSFIHP